jgi:four helix bundle protein
VWQEAMSLAESCYRLTRDFPREEVFGLTTQIRRSAASIAANVAEGHGRESTQSFIQFLRIAQGSLKELETHLLLAERVEIVASETTKELHESCAGLGKMLRSLTRMLQQKGVAGK